MGELEEWKQTKNRQDDKSGNASKEKSVEQNGKISSPVKVIGKVTSINLPFCMVFRHLDTESILSYEQF